MESGQIITNADELRDCELGIRIYDEQSSILSPKVGHVGIRLKTPEGETRQFDHGMVGSGISKGHLSKIHSAACAIAPFVCVAAYSAFGAIMANEAAPASPLIGTLATYAGGIYGGFLGMGVGITVENNAPKTSPTREIEIAITRTQHDDLIAYMQKKKFSFYSAAFNNCVTYTEIMLRNCNIKTAGRFSGPLTLPSTFARKMSDAHTQLQPATP